MRIHRGQEAIRFLSGRLHTDLVNVLCPSCGSDYTHVQHVGTLVGSDQAEAVPAYEGTFPSGTTPQRRSAVEIVFLCEQCPKLFALIIQQHKGINHVEIHEDVPSRAE
jgi:hypothetical protein